MVTTAEQVTSQDAVNILLTSVTVYFPLFFVLILLYEILRPRLPHVYSPENHVEFPESKQHKFLSWVPFVWRIDESQVAEKCGLDAWVLLRFMKMGRKVALMCVLCSLALFPMYFFTAAVFEAQEKEKKRHHLNELLPAEVEAANTSVAAITSMMMIILDKQPSVENGTSNTLSSDGKVKLDVVDRLTIANVGKDDWRLYFTVLVAYTISIYVMRLLLHEYTVYRKRRHEFLMRKHPQQYSVVISDLPQSQRRPQTLRAYLEFLFPNSVHSVYIGVECAELEELLGKRRELVYYLYAASVKLAEAESKVGHDNVIKRPKERINRRFFGLCGGGKEVDAVDHYTEKLQKLEIEIVRVRDEILQRQSTVKGQDSTSEKQYGSTSTTSRGFSTLNELAEKLRKTKISMYDPKWSEETLPLLNVSVPVPKKPNVMRSCAFVSFYSIRSAQAAQQLLQVENPRRMIVIPAPNIRDVLWKNFGLPHKLKAKWKLISIGVSLLIGCFWTVPTAFVASMASVDELRHLFPWLGGLMKNSPWLLIALQQTAPLVYSAMNGLANVIFKLLSTQEGHLSISEVEASRFTKLCFFQAFQMFFVSALAGSIITEFMLFLDQPRMLFFFLGNTIANQSMMFITFIITQICVDTSLFLLRVSPVAISVAYRFLAPMHAKLPQPRDWMGLFPINFQTDLDTPMNLAKQYLVFLFVVVFAPIAPLLGYFGAIFFVVSELSYKRCFFFVNSSRWAATNSMGVFWPPLYSFVIGALIIGQCTLIGLLSLKSAGYGPIGLMTVLPLSTLIFHWYAVDLSHVKRAAENLPLDQCCDIDEERKDDSFDFLDGVYQQPAMIEAFQPASILTRNPESGAGAVVDSTNEQADVSEPHAEPLNKPAKPLGQQTRLADLNKDRVKNE